MVDYDGKHFLSNSGDNCQLPFLITESTAQQRSQKLSAKFPWIQSDFG